jgi:hypothetical protein
MQSVYARKLKFGRGHGKVRQGWRVSDRRILKDRCIHGFPITLATGDGVAGSLVL